MSPTRFRRMDLFNVMWLAIATTALALSTTAMARTWSDGVKGQIGGSGRVPPMNYRYYLPAEYDPAQIYPLVLMLHGSAQVGFDDQHVSGFHVTDLINRTESQYPAILVAPQLPSRSGWHPENPEDRSLSLLTSVIFNQFSVDTDRLYITGISMGGYGLMSYLEYFNYQHSDLMQFAAGVPLAGAWPYGDSAVWDEYRQTPLWLIHGGADTSVEDSRYTYRTLAGLDFDEPIPFSATAIEGEPTATSGKTRYTEITGRGHDIWPDVYSSNDFYDWMFAQSLAVPEPSALGIAAAMIGLVFPRTGVLGRCFMPILRLRVGGKRRYASDRVHYS